MREAIVFIAILLYEIQHLKTPIKTLSEVG